MPLAARILVLALALMAATCGQKGPLTPPAQSTAAGASQTAAGAPGKRPEASSFVVEAERDA